MLEIILEPLETIFHNMYLLIPSSYTKKHILETLDLTYQYFDENMQHNKKFSNASNLAIFRVEGVL